MSKVSVIMPVYNAAKYVGSAIRSILDQTFTDFEFLIFNDGSNDDSLDVIRSFKDPRIKLFHYKENTGYVKHLNEGINVANGVYLARMDADDISHPERLERLVAYLDANPEIGLCGSWFDILDDASTVISVPTEHDELKIKLLLNSTFGHPCVIMRASVLRKHALLYDSEFMPAEDFKLWVELSRVTQIANVTDVLLHYRIHPGQISNTKKNLQTERIQAVRDLQVEYLLGRKMSVYEQKISRFLFGVPEAEYGTPFYSEVLRWAASLIKSNNLIAVYPPIAFREFVISRIDQLIPRNYFSRSLLFSNSTDLLIRNLTPKQKFKFYIKCLLNWSSPGFS